MIEKLVALAGLDNLDVKGNDFSEIKKPNELMPSSDGKLDKMKFDDEPLFKKAAVESLANQEVKGCPIDGNGGTWEGERGQSKWIPEDKEIPKSNNPENNTWKEIKEKHGFDGIEFENGQPDFSEIAEAEVEIEEFSTNRQDNFYQADEKLAEQRGQTVGEARAWRKENNYTWHECNDCKTLQLVPSEVHGNISHYGGISEKKKQEGVG